MPPDPSNNDDIISTLTRTIETVNLVKNLVPNQMAQGILVTTSQILVIIMNTIKNKEDFIELIKECSWIGKLMKESYEVTGEGEVSAALSEAMNVLGSTVKATHANLEKMAYRKFYKRLITSTLDKEKVQTMTAQLDRSLRNVQAALDFTNAKTLKANTKVLKRVEQNLRGLKVGSEFQISKSTNRSPPPRPSIFHGRDDLVHQICGTMLAQDAKKRRHVALLGSGGIGKSSLAKAVLNEPDIRAKFGNRRFFVRFDDILAFQITYPTFIDRISRTLGITTDADHSAILDDIKTHSTLLVLDNAETFLDTQGSRDVSHIKTAIGEIGSSQYASILITSRSRDLPRGLVWRKFEVPNLDASSAFETFSDIHHQNVSKSRSVVESILSSVDYHALTITLLAHTAEANGWSIEMLGKRWNARRTELFSSGRGKDENLAESIELSLDSPCVRAVGDDVRRVFRMLAFFPQGLPQDKLEAIFPSVPKIHDVVDVLHRQYLVIFASEFATMPAPFRLYATDAIPLPDTSLLADARSYYFRPLSSSVAKADNKSLISSEGVNIESLITFDLQSSSKDPGPLETMQVCTSFLECLRDFKHGRPTSLRAIVETLDCPPSSALERLKIESLWSLAHIAHKRSNNLEELELTTITRDLLDKRGDSDNALLLAVHLARDYVIFGRYHVARGLLDDAHEMLKESSKSHEAIGSAVLGQINEVDRAATGDSLAAAYEKAGDLFGSVAGKFADSHLNYARGAFAFALVDGDMTRSQVALHQKLDKSRRDNGPQSYYFRYLSAVAFMKRNTAKAERLVKHWRTLAIPIPSACEALLCLAVIKAFEEKFDDAREFIRQAEEELKVNNIISDRNRWWRLYISGAVALMSGKLSEADQFFQEAKKYCESRQEFHVRALALRARGEVRYIQKDFERAKGYFKETLALCREVGIVPRLLYRRSDITIWLARIPPATNEGWSIFLKETPDRT